MSNQKLQHTIPIRTSSNEPAQNTIKDDLLYIYDALCEKGYNPVNQIIGYIISEDPTYVTSHRNARIKAQKISREDILEVLIKEFLEKYRSNGASQ